MALVAQDQAQDLPDPGHSAEQVQGMRAMRLSSRHAISRQSAEEFGVMTEQGEVDVEALLDGGIGEALGNPVAIGFVGNLFPDRGPVGPDGWCSGHG